MNHNDPYRTKPGEINQCSFCYAGLGRQPHSEHYPQCEAHSAVLRDRGRCWSVSCTDLGDDPDGDLDDYDGLIACTCGPWAQGGRDINCPEHAEQNRQVLGVTHDVIAAAHLLGKLGIDGATYEKLVGGDA